MAEKGVKYLDISKFDEAVNTFDEKTKEYQENLKNIDKVTSSLKLSWHGEGRTAFEQDYATIYHQLKDVGEIMEEMSDAIYDAREAYSKTDDELGEQLKVE